ncbi:MAG: zinc-ribbon domain-containing protein [Candidatus Goldiibacteriota bacterium]|jgi:hypothetical protein
MERKCNACGAQNREDAKFCRSCGSPLPAIKAKLTQQELAHEKQVQKFWRNLIIGFAVIIIAAIFLMAYMDKQGGLSVAKLYSEKYASDDDMAFGTIKPGAFVFEGLIWGMGINDLKRVYPYATDSNDPDFKQSMMVAQHDLKTQIPHANFMSLGLYNGKLYALKFEFGENEKFESQQLKIPHKDEIMFGRFTGMYEMFKKLYGDPAYEQYPEKSMDVRKKIAVIKSGELSDGKPSNVYAAWNLKDAKAELAFFGYDGKLHLTVRFLSEPLWDQAAGEPQGQQGNFRNF